MEKPADQSIEGVDHVSYVNSTVDTPAEEDARPHLHSKTFLIVLAMYAIQFALLIQLVAAGAFAADVAAVIGGSDKSSWMLTALTITFVVLAPPISQAADYWGRRWFLIILCMIGFVGTLVASLATSMGMAIAGEVLVGACFAATPLTLAVVSEVLPHRLRLVAQAGISIANNLGSIFALLLGAALIRSKGPGGFRILFYINAGMFVLTALVTFFFYRPPVRELQQSLTTKEKLLKLDWIGYGLILVAAVLFVAGLSWAQNPYPWRDAHVLAPFVLGCVFFIILGIYSWKIKKDGLIHHALFSRDRNCALAFGGVFCEGLIFGVTNVFLPTQLIGVYGASAFRLSLVYTTAVLVSCMVAPAAVFICYRYKQLRILAVAGFVSFLIYGITMATSIVSGEAAFWGCQAFLGCGLMLVLSALVTAAQLSAPSEFISITSGLIASIRSLGVTVAVAIGEGIFHGQIAKVLPEKVAAAAIGNGLPKSSLGELLTDLTSGNAQDMLKIPGITTAIVESSLLALKHAYLDSVHDVWYACCAFAAIGLILSIFVLDPVKDLNNRIDAPVESERELYG
ncbi:siderophore iron transporter [Exophiala viscosa]|uniref:Siderophore iron transporter n=1 Tax=Exophiala viscosa TaxID=2486360 RepID=A0AAN6IGT3_9EURO|nr:siderophore iron transporter [Exophiala viscosa]